DLLHGTYGDEAAAQRRARHVGYPLHGSHIVVLVDIDDFRGFNRARQISEDAIQALKRDFLRRLTALVRASYQRALVQGRSGQVAAVSDERLVDYSRRHLGPLVEHDAARKSALVATLRAYLETGEQQHAAQRLRVHPNTLRYRLDRIREITGLNLEDPETRLNLSVALRVQALLGM